MWTTSWPPSAGPGSTLEPRSPGRRPRRGRVRDTPEAELSTLLTIAGIVAFAIGLLFSIAFHEGGHFFWARRFGMRVPQFMVGFGPTVFSRRRGETEYGVKLVPLGGYIRIVGMIPPAEEGESKRATRMRSFIAEVRGAALNDVLPTDGDRVFYAKPWWQRVVVMFAGPFHNLVLAVVFFAVTLCGIGTQVLTTTISEVPACVLPATAPASATCDRPVDGVLPQESPAARAGLRPGDTIVAIAGHTLDRTGVNSWTAVQDAIRSNPGHPIPLTIERGGRRQLLTVTPIANTVYADATGQRTITAGYLGVSPTAGFARQPVSALPGYFGGIVRQSVDKLVQIPSRVPQLFSAAFAGAKRDANGPIGVVGVGRISGEVFAQPTFTGLEKLSFFLGLLASVNLVLFLFNLLPIYPLDGGHVAGALYERVRAGIARSRGRPDPGPFDIARLMPVAYVVAGVFLVFSAVLVIADIVNPVTL